MNTTSDTDIEELKELINSQFNSLQIGQTRMEEQVRAIDKPLDSIDQRLDRLEGRLEKQDNRFWALVGGAFLALFGLLAKLAFFPNQLT